MLSFEWNKEVLTSLDKEVACNINLHWRQFASLSPVAGLCLVWKGSDCTKLWGCRRWRGPHRPASIPPRPQGPGSSLLWTLSRSSTLDMKSRLQRYGTLTGRLFREKATFMIMKNIHWYSMHNNILHIMLGPGTSKCTTCVAAPIWIWINSLALKLNNYILYYALIRELVKVSVACLWQYVWLSAVFWACVCVHVCIFASVWVCVNCLYYL